MKRLISCALLSLSLVGCASVTMGDAQQDAARKTFTAAPGKAGIYVYRNESMGAAIRMPVTLDGKEIGETAANTYLFREVEPGKHSVTSQGGSNGALELNLKPGTLAFVWQEVKMGLIGAGSKLHLMPEAEGQKGVLETKLAVGR